MAAGAGNAGAGAAAGEYRRRADECHQKAEAAKNEVDEASWLMMAAQWSKLADHAERPKKHRP
jgi:hypothetical protein